MGIELVSQFIESGLQAARDMSNEVCNIRYGEPGKILFDFRDKTYSTLEPFDVMPVAYPDSLASKVWCMRQFLSKNVHSQ